MKCFNDAVFALLQFLREALSEDGQGSWSRMGSAIVVAALVFVMITTRSIPERTRGVGPRARCIVRHESAEGVRPVAQSWTVAAARLYTALVAWIEEMLRALTTSQVLERIKAFDMRYVNDWSDWLRVSKGCDFQAAPIPIPIAIEFKRIMGKWQACRPKPLRSATELQSTLDLSIEPLRLLGPANLRCFQAPGQVLTGAICSLWQIFEDGLCLKGKATEVGITKAILLVTKGRIGPAFDSNVKTRLNAWYVTDCKTYMKALGGIASELAAFEARELRSLDDLAGQAGRPVDVGRAVDMVLGPR